MADSVTSAAERDDERAPWWAWGFVVTVPPALLALVTTWFDAAPPKTLVTWGSDNHLHYNAWTHAVIGMICPFFLAFLGLQWLGARLGYCPPPAPGDWRHAWRVVPGLVGVRQVTMNAGRSDGPETVWYPYRTGSWCSIALGVVSLAALGINRASFKPTYMAYNLVGSQFENGDMVVRPAFGFWCLLGAAVVSVVTGVFGVLQRVRPWWETGA